jgi:hypothetical protein
MRHAEKTTDCRIKMCDDKEARVTMGNLATDRRRNAENAEKSG